MPFWSRPAARLPAPALAWRYSAIHGSATARFHSWSRATRISQTPRSAALSSHRSDDLPTRPIAVAHRENRCERPERGLPWPPQPSPTSQNLRRYSCWFRRPTSPGVDQLGRQSRAPVARASTTDSPAAQLAWGKARWGPDWCWCSPKRTRNRVSWSCGRPVVFPTARTRSPEAVAARSELSQSRWSRPTTTARHRRIGPPRPQYAQEMLPPA